LEGGIMTGGVTTIGGTTTGGGVVPVLSTTGGGGITNSLHYLGHQQTPGHIGMPVIMICNYIAPHEPEPPGADVALAEPDPSPEAYALSPEALAEPDPSPDAVAEPPPASPPDTGTGFPEHEHGAQHSDPHGLATGGTVVELSPTTGGIVELSVDHGQNHPSSSKVNDLPFYYPLLVRNCPLVKLVAKSAASTI
jgi:hypothetical protein